MHRRTVCRSLWVLRNKRTGKYLSWFTDVTNKYNGFRYSINPGETENYKPEVLVEVDL